MRENISTHERSIQASPVEMHRRQMIRQVWLPLGVSIIVVLALMILAIIGTVQGNAEVNRWGNIFGRLHHLARFVFGAASLGILGGADYGLAKLLKKLHGWMLRAQLFMIHLSLTIRRAADSTTVPIFKVNTFATRVTTLWDKILRRKPAR
jgi:hypothetical protein